MDFYFNISVFLLCMVILADGLDLGGDPRRDDPRLSERRRPRDLWLQAPGRRIDFDLTKYQFGFYGVIIVLMMLFRPGRPDPERRHKRELELGVHDTPADVMHEGSDTDRDSGVMTDQQSDLLKVAETVRKEFGGLVATNNIDFTIRQG